MNKQDAIKAINDGAKMIYSSPITGMSALAWINNQPVRISTAREFMRSILVMEKKSGSVSTWTKK